MTRGRTGVLPNMGDPGEAQILKPPTSKLVQKLHIHVSLHAYMQAATNTCTHTHMCLNNRLRPFCPTSQNPRKDEAGVRMITCFPGLKRPREGDQGLETLLLPT